VNLPPITRGFFPPGTPHRQFSPPPLFFFCVDYAAVFLFGSSVSLCWPPLFRRDRFFSPIYISLPRDFFFLLGMFSPPVVPLSPVRTLPPPVFEMLFPGVAIFCGLSWEAGLLLSLDFIRKFLFLLEGRWILAGYFGLFAFFLLFLSPFSYNLFTHETEKFIRQCITRFVYPLDPFFCVGISQRP